jgi:hypothetical protein
MNATASIESENILESFTEEFPIDHFAASIVFVSMIAATIICWCLLICCCGNKLKCDCWLVTATIFFIISMGLLAIYSFQLDTLNRQDYLGPMRITGVYFKLRTEKTCTSSSSSSSTTGGGSSSSTTQKCASTTYYDAILDVNWGYDWACPDLNDKVCDSEVTICSTKACGGAGCTASQEEKAFTKVYDCAVQTYNPDLVYEDFDSLVGPANDVNWPSVVAYGDCDKCNSQLAVPNLTVARGFKIAGGVFLLIAVAIACGLLVRRLMKYVRSRRGNSSDGAVAATNKNTIDSLPQRDVVATTITTADVEENKAPRNTSAISPKQDPMHVKSIYSGSTVSGDTEESNDTPGLYSEDPARDGIYF